MMLLQTNSYVVPKDKRTEHVRLLNRFRQTLARFGCEDFEVFEQAGSNWGASESSGRYVQMIRFRDKKHHMAVQAAERSDPAAQKLIAEFCELINFPYQQQQGLFAVGFYNGVLPAAGGARRVKPAMRVAPEMPAGLTSVAGPAVASAAVAAAVHDPIIDDAVDLSPQAADESMADVGHQPADQPDLHVDLSGDVDEEPTENVDLESIDLEAELTEPEADDANTDVKR